ARRPRIGVPLLDPDFQFIRTELDAIAVVKLLGHPPAERIVAVIEEGAIGAEVVKLPIAHGVDDPTMPLGQMAVRVGNDPLVIVPPTYGELAAVNLAPLRGHFVGTADHDKR